MSEYRESDILRRLRARLAEHSGKKPGDYDSRWQEALDSVVSQILSREDFAYDPETDPLFHQYRDRYVGLGRLAMEDTLGQAAKLTGGYGNSHAQLAGQQAYESHLQGLFDKLPELTELAMERYRLQGDGLHDRYGILSDLEKGDYSRYRDSYGLWEEERDYLTDRFDAERDFDYGVHRDGVEDGQWQQEFDEDLRRFNFKNKLGQFAPKPASGGSGSGGSGKTPGKAAEDSVTKPEKKRSKSNAAVRRTQ